MRDYLIVRDDYTLYGTSFAIDETITRTNSNSTWRMTLMNNAIKQLINGYQIDITNKTVIEQVVDQFRNLTNALFVLGQFEEPFKDTDADYIEKHLGWAYDTPTHVTLAIK